MEWAGRTLGYVGELHPRWSQAYELPCAPMVFELNLAALLERDVPAFVPLPRHQAVWRDIAVIAGEAVTHDALIEAVRATPTPLLRSAQLFDVYKPGKPVAEMAPSERSMAVRLELLDDENTLTDDRIDGVVSQVLQTLRERLGVRLRS